MGSWLIEHGSAVIAWCAAISTFAIYSILYRENKFYRFFEHLMIGLAAGYGIYQVWFQVLLPEWWTPMVDKGQWYYALYLVPGSMFYFIYSKKHAWVSRVIFGLFMGLAAGGIFREFYEIYFPQMGASMKPIAGGGMSVWQTLNVLIFYVILFAAMFYFFFSFEHKNPVVKKTASMGRWFLMVGFGAIFGATVMGRMTLFVGRLDYLLNQWWIPQVHDKWGLMSTKVIVFTFAALVIGLLIPALMNARKPHKKTEE